MSWYWWVMLGLGMAALACIFWMIHQVAHDPDVNEHHYRMWHEPDD